MRNIPISSGDVVDAAREWLVRLTSGDMTERELESFHHWAKLAKNDEVFQQELANWRKLEAIRGELAPEGPSARQQE